MTDDNITDEMSFAGADILCARVDGFSEPGRYQLAIDTANEIYRAMVALTPKSPSTGKAEPPPGWPGDGEA